MTLDDDRLLDFDAERLSHYDADEAHDTLAGEDGDLFRNHLLIAKWIDRWIENMAGDVVYGDPENQQGFEQALRELAAHLRQGDFVPGGVLHDDIATSFQRS